MRAIANGANPETALQNNDIIFNHFSEKDISRILTSLLEKGVDVNAHLSFGEYSLLYSAMSNSFFQVARVLLAVGADPVIGDDTGNTALHIASGQMPDDELADALIARMGDDLSKVNVYGENALHIAVAYGSTDFGRKLIAAGIDLQQRNDKGQTPLEKAISEDKPALFEDILAKANETKIRLDLEAAMFLAVRHDRICMIQKLEEYGVDIHVRDEKGKTLLIEAASCEAVGSLYFLLPRISPAEKDEEGRTALMHAARTGHSCLVALLIAGADLSTTDNEGRTAYMLADKTSKILLDLHPAGLAQFLKIDDAAIELRQGGGLTTIFNFLTGQAITRTRAGLVTQAFDEVPRQAAIAEAREALIAQDGHPPEYLSVRQVVLR